MENKYFFSIFKKVGPKSYRADSNLLIVNVNVRFNKTSLYINVPASYTHALLPSVQVIPCVSFRCT